MNDKRCGHCGQIKSSGEFYRSPSTRDGLMATCSACNRERANAYHTANREEINARQRLVASGNRGKERAKNRTWAANIKMQALNAYGGPHCACCGETLIEGLSLDHIAGDGAQVRKQNRDLYGKVLYRTLKKLGYPPGYQVLCFTCNFAKSTNSYCPHEDLAIAWG